MIKVSGGFRRVLPAEQQLSAVKIRLGQIRSYFNRAIKIRQRSVRIALRLSDKAAIKEGDGVGRVDLNCASIVRHSPSQIALALFGVAPIVVGRGEIRVEFDGLIEVGDGPAQVILPVDRVTLDLDPVPVAPDDLPARVEGVLGRGFDVTTGVPIRAALFALDPTTHVLVLTVHHISGDGFSTGPLARDVFTAYVARRSGAVAAWRPLTVQYADYALWQRETLGERTLPAERLAQEASYADGPHFRAALDSMAGRGLLQRTPDGYRAAAQPRKRWRPKKPR